MNLDEEDSRLMRKRLYARIFAQAEGLRWTLKAIAEGVDVGDVDRIESEVRERIRKKKMKGMAEGERLLDMYAKAHTETERAKVIAEIADKRARKRKG
jgi:hypothetical protein